VQLAEKECSKKCGVYVINMRPLKNYTTGTAKQAE
jgi:hypothetical protein